MPPAQLASSHGPSPAPIPFYAAVLLASGRATRMGCPKLLLPLAGQPLLQLSLDAVAASCLSEVVMVVGPEVRERLGELSLPKRIPLTVVENRDPEAGQSHSLQIGLEAASSGTRAAAIVLGDEPQLDAGRIDSMARIFQNTEKPAARPVYCSPPEPPVPGHPVFVARRLWQEIGELRGDQGLRDWLSNRPETLLEVEHPGPAPRDIDTWDDYRAAGGTASAGN